MSGGAITSSCVLAGAIVLAGCGGQSASPKERYEKQFRAALTRFKQRGATLRPGQSARTQLAATEKLRALTLELDDDLAQIKPPREVAEAHRLLVDGIRGWQDGMVRRAIAEERAGHFAKAAFVFTHPSRSELPPLVKAKRARDIFRAKGYHLGINGGFLP